MKKTKAKGLEPSILSSSKIPESIKSLIQTIVQITHPKKLLLFGSRARGSFRKNSDFDLCVIKKACSEANWNQLLVSIENDPMTLYGVDLVEFEKLPLTHQNKIEAEGITLYESNG